MSAPVLDSFAGGVYKGMASIAWEDADHGYALALYLAAIGTMFQIVDDYGRDRVDDAGIIRPGWSILFDIDNVPEDALPYVGQYIGVSFDAGLPVAEKRQRIRDANNWKRGTPGAIITTAQRYLTGTKTVFLRERDNGAYHFTVNTRLSETPNPDALKSALIIEQKPAGLVMVVQQIVGQDFQHLLDNHATFTLVNGYYSNMQGILEDIAGTPSAGPLRSGFPILLGVRR